MSSTPRDKLLNTRVTKEEHARIVAKAKAAGVDISTYLRARALSDDERVELASANYVQLAENLDGMEDAIAQARSMLGAPRRRK